MDALIPMRSTLFNIEPIGVGSSVVESLTSYIVRIAAAHRVKPGDLFSCIFFPYLNKHYMDKIATEGGNGFYNWAQMINGISSSADEFVKMIVDLTGNKNVDKLTLLRFQEILSNRGLLRAYKAWCPACLEEMRDQVLYEPLLWNIKTAVICLRHETLLVDKCQVCSIKNMVMERKSAIGYCSKCSSWLGRDARLEPEVKISDWEKVMTLMTEELLFSSAKYERQAVQQSLNKLVYNFANSNIAHFAKMVGVPKTTFWGWYHGKNLPILEDVIRICNKFGIGISEFYSNRLATDKSTFIPAIRKKKVNLNLTETPIPRIGVLAKQIISDSNYEKSTVNELARLVKCNKKTLYKYYDSLCKEQAYRNKKFRSNQRKKRLKTIKLEMGAAVNVLIDSGIAPNKKRVETQLNRQAMFKESSIRVHYYKIIAANIAN